MISSLFLHFQVFLKFVDLKNAFLSDDHPILILTKQSFFQSLNTSGIPQHHTATNHYSRFIIGFDAGVKLVSESDLSSSVITIWVINCFFSLPILTINPDKGREFVWKGCYHDVAISDGLKEIVLVCFSDNLSSFSELWKQDANMYRTCSLIPCQKRGDLLNNFIISVSDNNNNYINYIKIAHFTNISRCCN